MSFDENEASYAPEYQAPDSDADDRTPLALATGIVAAVVAGALWALLVRVTGYEIGYAAWGVGLLVGVGMSRVTRNRSKQLATAAAGFAIVGLVVGKLFIFLGSASAFTQDLREDDEMLKSAVAWMLYDDRELDAATLDELDATLATGDTLSDAVWSSMMDQAGARLDAMDAGERDAAATRAARAVLRRIGPLNGVIGQFTAFDLLWLLFATLTAYRFMKPADVDEPVAPQPA